MTVALAGCGGKQQEQGFTRGDSTSQLSGGTQTPSTTTTGEAGARVPSEAQIKSAQKVTIKPSPDTATGQGGEVEASQRVDAEPGASTAPARVLALGKRAALSWIEYRINGATPSADVLPRSVLDGVPPAQPSERVKGAALTKELYAFSAHPQDNGWVVMVSSSDPRVELVVVTIDGPATSPKVSGIWG